MQLHRFLLLSALVACGSSSNSGGATTPTDAGVTTDSSTGAYDPKGITIGNERVTGMRFLDANNGFLLLAGDTPDVRGVWATTDGGASWTKREIDLAAGGIDVTPDGARFWVVGTNETSNLWSSPDRGQTFAPLSWTMGGPGRIAFVDASTVLVTDFVGDEMYRTIDGGTTWAEQDLPGTTAAAHISAIGQDVWLAGGGFGQSGAQVTRSTDGGATWSMATLTDNAHAFEGGELNAVRMVSATDVWVAGDSRQLYHTTDGTNWMQVAGIPASFDQLGGIAVNGARVTVAGGSDNGYALYESDDSGATFHAAEEIRCPARCGQVIGIESPSPNVMFVYGDGLLWRVVR